MEAPHRNDRVTAREVAATPCVERLVARVASETEQDVTIVRTRALQCLAELETGHSRPFRRLVVKAGRALCRLGYDRIDVDPGQLARVRELFQTSSVVVLSSHRSYLDGAALTVAFEDSGLPPPFEFVGINMAFWPLGPLWRRMGGILLRRQADDPVYRAALRGFLAHLVATRRPVRWFIEGTRSRTGKLAPPKLGLLAYVIDGYLAGDSTDLKLLPVSVSYDQLQEVDEFSDEARGGSKDAESVGWLVRYLRAQRGRFGTIHVRFGEPISVRDSLGPPGIRAAGEGDAHKLAVQKLALEVCWRINTATPITDIALVAIALLAARGRALSASQIRIAVRGYRESASSRGLPLVAAAGDEETALQQSLEALQSREIVDRTQVDDVECFGVAPGRHLALGYYRNTLVHFFLEDAIGELALLAAIEASPETREGTFHAAALELRELLKFDFFFRDKAEFSASVEARMRRLDPKWLARLPEGLHGAIHLLEHADILCSDMMLRPFIEAHALVADTLLDAEPATLLDEAGFLTACEARGGAYLRDRRLRHPESVSRVLFRTGIQMARDRQIWGDAPDCARRRADLAARMWSIVRRMDIVHGIAVRRLEQLVSDQR